MQIKYRERNKKKILLGPFGFLRPHYGSAVSSDTDRNEYQWYVLQGKGGRCVGLTTLLSLCADCFEILGASTSWSPGGLSRPVVG
jgi:hypothetical protein